MDSVIGIFVHSFPLGVCGWKLINVLKWYSIFENYNLLKTQIALHLCNLGDDMGMGKENPALLDLFPLRFQVPDLRLHKLRRNKMEEGTYYWFITNVCKPNCTTLCINFICEATGDNFQICILKMNSTVSKSPSMSLWFPISNILRSCSSNYCRVTNYPKRSSVKQLC